ncbi:hypothetical protein C8Q77DRAFT_1067482 [Trametes polyzona]|nr:hypothetical protein C8Q77DRAFT_1067482 [Trametes polyzona]
MSNFTLDDTDPTLTYSANGWATQLPTDPDLDEFFDRTYHAAQTDGASMTFTFRGVGFAVYGTKGPGHGKYRVQFDSTVVTLDASAPETAFRQELFAHTFTPANASATHFVNLTAVLSGDGVQGRWLDVDYITFASSPASDAAPSVSTITSLPPWLTGSSQTPSPSNTPFASASASASGSDEHKSSKVPTILAALFGALIGLALILFGVYLVLKRTYDRRRARERAFRYGQSSANPSVSLAGTAATGTAAGVAAQGINAYYANSAAGSGKSAGLGAGAGAGGVGGEVIDLVPLRRESGVLRDGSLSEMRSMSTDVHGQGSREGAASPAGASGGGGSGGGGGGGASRPLLSASPIAWTRQKVGGRHKGDADSLRTDFLQV